MSDKNLKPVTVAVGAALATSVGAVSVASADTIPILRPPASRTT